MVLVGVKTEFYHDNLVSGLCFLYLTRSYISLFPSSKERKQFKQVTLALLYGMGTNQVARKLGITNKAAVAMTDDFYRRFRGVKTWMDRIKSQARRDLYVTTIAGRRRYLDDINSDDGNRRAQAERQSVNTVIQGSAADLMKFAMVNVARNLRGWTAGANGASGLEPKIL